MTRGLKDFSAIESTDLAGGNRKLTVSGKVETRSSNETPTLCEAVPQGINPAILILDVVINETGAGNDVMDYKEVEPFVKAISQHEYTEVTIRAEGTSETIKVKEVFS